MTTKEIAEAVGKTERSIQMWVKACGEKISSMGEKISSSTSTHPADYDQSETLAIIEHGMGKNAAGIFRANMQTKAQQLPQNGEVGKSIDELFKMAIIELSNMTKNHEARLSKIETRIEQRQALLPAPQIKPRDHVSKLVRDYANRNKIEYQEAWGDLYMEYAYRTNTNPRLIAKRRGMTVIDYIETEGMVEILESIAMDVLG